MKPVVTGILSFIVGTAAGAGVMASSDKTPVNANDKAAIESIVHDYILANPDVIVDSVKKWQEADTKKQADESKAQIEKSHNEIYNAPHDAYAGSKDGDVTVVEFFDYNCPACKMMFKGLDQLVKSDSKVHVIFKELPIFGPSSDENSKVGIAVAALAPDKYFAFHEQMMSSAGRATSQQAIAVAASLGIDKAKLEDEMKKDYVTKKISDNHALSDKLGINGTPALVIDGDLIPSAMDYSTLKGLIDKAHSEKK